MCLLLTVPLQRTHELLLLSFYLINFHIKPANDNLQPLQVRRKKYISACSIYKVMGKLSRGKRTCLKINLYCTPDLYKDQSIIQSVIHELEEQLWLKMTDGKKRVLLISLFIIQHFADVFFFVFVF